MNQKKLIIIISAVLVVVLACAAAILAFGTPKLTKTVSVRGYEISVPENWSVDSKGNFYTQKGDHAGKLILIDEPVNKDNAVDFCQEEVKGDKKITKISEELIKYTFTSGKGETEMYFIPNLKNPEPYGASVVIYADAVSGNLGKKIAKSFKTPEFGSNPPKKNINAPDVNTADAFTVIKTEHKDGTVSVKNTELLSGFDEKIKNKESYGINIINYIEEEDEHLTVKSWKYAESSNGKGYLYTYYDKGEGIYTYDNNPIVFDAITKEIFDGENTASYTVNSEDDNVAVIKLPLDEADEKNEEDKENSQTDKDTPESGDVVYSGTVVISYNTLVTHPDTGEKVEIGPYAEARGYGGYLGKAINCVIKRAGSGYIATASCNGATILSYPLSSEAELNWAISMIKAYS